MLKDFSSILYFLPRVHPFVPTLPVPHDLNVTYDYGYIRGIAGFIAGMLTYIGYQQKAISDFFNNDFVSISVIFAMLLLFHFGVNDLEAVLKPFMDYFTCLFPYEQLNFKSNKANYCFQNKIAHKKIYKQTNLKKGFKTASY